MTYTPNCANNKPSQGVVRQAQGTARYESKRSISAKLKRITAPGAAKSGATRPVRNIPVRNHDTSSSQLPDFHCSKSTKRSLLKHGQAIELSDGSLQMRAPLDLTSPRKAVYSNGTGGGWWSNRKSGGGFVVKQFDRMLWPINQPKQEPRGNGWPNRMVLGEA